jgi:dihydrofolate reductase
MRPLRYFINVTLDGCCDHRAIIADDQLHRHALVNIEKADALLFGRVTYEMMEDAWRGPARPGERPEWMEPFARTIDAAKKYVVSSTLDRVDWNAELLRGDLGEAVDELKRQSGKGLLVGGLKLPLALAELGLIDEYEFAVHPALGSGGAALPARKIAVSNAARGVSTPSETRRATNLVRGDDGPKCQRAKLRVGIGPLAEVQPEAK